MTKMASNKFLLIVRFVAFIAYGYSVYYIWTYETLPPEVRGRPFGKWKYLTYWDWVNYEFFFRFSY